MWYFLRLFSSELIKVLSHVFLQQRQNFDLVRRPSSQLLLFVVKQNQSEKSFVSLWLWKYKERVRGATLKGSVTWSGSRHSNYDFQYVIKITISQ